MANHAIVRLFCCSSKSFPELCHGVEVEPSLQPLSGESFQLRSANTEDGVRLDVVTNGFWECGQNA